MQILKGEILKSVTIQHIMNDSDSCCLVYYDAPLPIDGCYFVNSKENNLDKLYDFFQDFLSHQRSVKYDYFIYK